MTLARVAVSVCLCAAAGFALPTAAQTPCTDPQTIGCDYHPDYGWIVRGSAPRKEDPGPKSHTEKLIEEYKSRPPPRALTPEEAEREHKRQVDAELDKVMQDASDRFYMEQAMNRRTVARLSKTGTCPPGAGVVEGSSARDSYHRTREACLIGYTGTCEALTNVCQGDPITAADLGRCYFGPAHEWARYYTKPHGELLSELRKDESACVKGRVAEACTGAAMAHTFAAIPEANPQNAYHFANLACQYGKPTQLLASSRPEVRECVSKLTDCYVGAPAPQQSAGLAPSASPKLVTPKGTCTFPKRARSQAKPSPEQAAQQAKYLRESEQRCANREPADCLMAGEFHALLDIPEAKGPERAYYFMSLACEYAGSDAPYYCGKRDEGCTGSAR
jgi:hypothetical protein